MKRKIFTLILSVFTLAIMAQKPTSIFVTGTFNSWATADPAYQMTFDNANNVFHIKFTMPAGENHFKLFDGSWGNSSTYDKIITLTAPKEVNIYARQAWKFIYDVQDTIYINGGAVNSGLWDYTNLVPLKIDPITQQGTAVATINDWQQANMYRLMPGDPKTIIWDGVWSKPDFTGGNFIFYETKGAIRTIVFDFATYTPTLAPQERFDLAYTLDGTTWLTAPLNDDPNSTDLLKTTLTLPAAITASQYCVKYSQDGSAYPTAIDGFTVIKNFSTLANIKAGVDNTFQVSRSSANPNWDLNVSLNTALKDVLNNKLSYLINNKQITVNAENTTVELFSVSGQKLANATVNGAYTFTVKQSGVYLLRSKGASYKVVIK